MNQNSPRNRKPSEQNKEKQETATNLERLETTGIGLKSAQSDDGAEPDFIKAIRQQVIDMFYGDLRRYMEAIKSYCPPGADVNSSDHPQAKAFFTVLAADKAGRITDHIAFDGNSITHLSEEGNTFMLLYLDLQRQIEPESVEDA